jgi:hypothetical protein
METIPAESAHSLSNWVHASILSDSAVHQVGVDTNCLMLLLLTVVQILLDIITLRLDRIQNARRTVEQLVLFCVSTIKFLNTYAMQITITLHLIDEVLSLSPIQQTHALEASILNRSNAIPSLAQFVLSRTAPRISLAALHILAHLCGVTIESAERPISLLAYLGPVLGPSLVRCKQLFSQSGMAYIYCCREVISQIGDKRQSPGLRVGFLYFTNQVILFSLHCHSISLYSYMLVQALQFQPGLAELLLSPPTDSVLPASATTTTVSTQTEPSSSQMASTLNPKSCPAVLLKVLKESGDRPIEEVKIWAITCLNSLWQVLIAC